MQLRAAPRIAIRNAFILLRLEFLITAILTITIIGTTSRRIASILDITAPIAIQRRVSMSGPDIIIGAK
jgi:hypothetical protein